MVDYYEGVDSNGVFHRVEKRIDPLIDGTRLVQGDKPIYNLKDYPAAMSVQEFDQLILASIPQEVLDKINDVIDQANHLAEKGKAEPVQDIHKEEWRRGMYLSWIHSRDMTVIMKCLGFNKQLTGIHDLGETCKAKYLKKRLGRAEQWYIDHIMSIDDNEDVIIGFYNPNFSGSLYNWGHRKMGVQNAMDAHRLSDHHLGNDDNPLDYIEKAVNFINHHIPREHYGIRHEAQGNWSNIEEIMTVDHSTRNNPLLRTICRDIAIVYQQLEKEGRITPWQLLDPNIQNAIPRNIDLKPEKSNVLRSYSVAGTALYNPDNDLWSMGGESGWRIVESTNGDPLSARILFAEELEENYVLTVTPRSYGPSRILSNQVVHSDSTGFRILLDTDDEVLNSIIGFDFQVEGVKRNVVPDDRTIVKDKLIEDLHAVENILSHEAEFGMITVMCSASVRELSELENEKARRKLELDSLKNRLNQTRIDAEIDFLKYNIEKTESRLARVEKLIKSSKYWDSAKSFGEMWGQYCVNEQEKSLGGRHIPVCTGGGPGIMHAIALGAREKNAQVIGIDSIFGNDNRFDLSGDFSTASNVRLRCNDFAIREAALINYSHVVLFWPGGYGTSWEAFETLCKLQTDHLRRQRTKAIFVHREFWQPLFDYISHLMEQGTVNHFDDRIRIAGYDDNLSEDRYVAEVVDDARTAFEVTKTHIEYLYTTNNLSLR